MKVYFGIKQADSHIYMAALNSEGKTILKAYFPSICPPQAIINSLPGLSASLWCTLENCYLSGKKSAALSIGLSARKVPFCTSNSHYENHVFRKL